jgi:diaminohydroxyphosphoribosylaminopyrimidine deaminase / 5-amino-6-(5-phosphoribosylamino)uracil reductase
MTDQELILRTFELARRGHGTTWPNPMVGAVIVKNGRIISEGHHIRSGEPHAELDAINKATEDLKGSSIYVNLEPCCHSDKITPPCAQRLIQEGFKKVVIANLDPNPSVNGKGVELLRSHGVEAIHGLCQEEGEKLNEVFFTAQRYKRPFIHFKSAITLDGKTALLNGNSQWITGERARTHVHEMRALHQGIIVGGQTVRKDNPRLTVRLPDYKGPRPWRIVLTNSGDLPGSHHLFTDEYRERTLVYSKKELSFSFPHKIITSLQDAMNDLYQRKIINVMLECGPDLAASFLKEKLIDRVTLFQNTGFFGAGRDLFGNFDLQDLSKRPVLTDIESRWFGEDHLITGRLKCSQD